MFIPWLCIPMPVIGMVIPADMPMGAMPGAMLVIRPGAIMGAPIMPRFGCMGVRVGVVGEENTSNRSLAAADDDTVGVALGGMAEVGDVGDETAAALN